MNHALVCFGNEESYGMLFVGGELNRYEQDFHFFDAENDLFVVDSICESNPDTVMFSPMTTFFNQSYEILKQVKQRLPNIMSVYGGHHATALPDIIQLPFIDMVVRGPVRGAIPYILNGFSGVITTEPGSPSDLSFPARYEYYSDIPRMKERYRKVMISMLGCPFGCSYCSSSSLHRRELFGSEAQKNYFLGRRSIRTLIEEAKQIKKYPTDEIEWVDDDIFTNSKEYQGWLWDFIIDWEREIGIPMYVSTTSLNALKVSDTILERLRKIVNCVGVGVQAIRRDSLKLFNRGWDNEEMMKKAYDRLVSFGYNVNLQAIVGLPVEDPVEDAIETLEGLKRIGEGSIASIYPLQIYPNTHIERISKERGFEINDGCSGDTNTGIGGIKFSKDVERRLRNICKFGTLYIKGYIDDNWRRVLEDGGYNKVIQNTDKIDKEWLQLVLDVEFDSRTSHGLSVARYRDCVIDRLGPIKGQEVFDKITRTTNIRS